jgi:transcriptional regulator GlxA family with amidase domain
MASRRIVIVTFPGIQALDLVGPLEVFVGASQVVGVERPGRAPAYAVEIVSTGGTTITSESGLTIATAPLPSANGRFDTILIAGGFGVYQARTDATLVDWLRAAAPRARRVGTVCTGTFLAAEAGLLESETVTTHWLAPNDSRRSSPHSTSTRIRSSPATVACGRQPASLQESTWRWRWSRMISAPTSPRQLPGGW